MKVEGAFFAFKGKSDVFFVKSNPCCICSCENFCPIKYKGACKIWVDLKSALFAVDEVKE